jgi:general secretion pathway protein G
MRRIIGHAAPRGLTLMEIMIVLVILGMIASVVAWNMMKAKDEADRRVAALNIQGLRQAVLSYRLRTNEFPEALAELEDREIEHTRVDPWGQPWIYVVTKDKFTIRSAGPDRIPNNEDDVTGEEEPGARKSKR